MRRTILFIYLTGLWAHSASVAAASEEYAYEFEALYTGEAWRNASGGIERGSRYLDNVDLTLDIDGQRAFGADQWRFFGYVLYDNGRAFNGDFVGSAQGVTNIETLQALRLYELWAEWTGTQAPVSVRAGLYDLNSEFDAIDAASLFINPSHGIGPDFSQSGLNGPSIFPVTSLGVRARYDVGDWSIQMAVLDAVPGDMEKPKRTTIKLRSDEGALTIAEAVYVREFGRTGIGYWRYTAAFDDLLALNNNDEPIRRYNNAGYYLYAESSSLFAGADDTGLRLFARYGRANSRINSVESYAGVGAVWQWQDDHAVGMAIGRVEMGESEKMLRSMNGMNPGHAETNVELTYRRALNGWLLLQADVQRITQPNMDRDIDNAWVFGLRIEVGRTWSWQ